MPILAKRWAGRLYGTNTGNLFMELTQDGANVKGVARFMDHLYGLALYEFAGEFDESLKLDCKPLNPKEGQELGDIKVEAILTPTGYLRGEWHSTIGTAGTFDAFPHEISSVPQDISKPDNVPEQIYNKNIRIGSVRLFSDNIKKILAFIKQDFTQGRSVVTCIVRGSQVTKYSEDFIREIETLGEINYLKVTIQEPEAHGINKVVVLELVENGVSEVRVSGISEAWVLGKAESIAEEIKPNQNVLVTTYRKYGLNINAIIFLAMLVAIPEISSWFKRAIFVVTVVILLSFLLLLHRKFIPNTVIYLTKQEPSFFKKAWPTILSWVIAVSSSLFAAWIFYLLTRSGGS